MATAVGPLVRTRLGALTASCVTCQSAYRRHAHPEDKELEAVSHALMNQIPWVYRHIAAAEKSKEMEALLQSSY